MMKLNIALMILVAAGVAMVLPAWAFPTQAEIKTATDVVGDLVADDVRAANAGKAKHEDVADKILALVDQAETDAAKWVLYKNAFIQYAKAGDFTKAGEVLTDTLAAFPDVPPKALLTLIERNAGKANAKNAPTIMRIRKLMHVRQKCSGIVASAKASPKEKAEAYCLTGDWKKGLKMFESLGGKTAEMAAAETNGKQPKHVIANYWWDYECALDTCDQFKAHAAEIYKAGLEDGSIAGLYKNVAEKRIAEMEAVPQATAASDTASGNDELSKLKKICNTKGLVHCWRFNGDLKDCVGKGEAKCCGNAKIDKRQASIFGNEGGVAGSCIDLGSGIIPNDGSAVTIELWAMQNKIGSFSRIFSFGSSDGRNIFMTWSRHMDPDNVEVRVAGYREPGNHIWHFGSQDIGSRYELGVEYHIVLVFERSSRGWTLSIYKQDAKTGNTILKSVREENGGWTLKGYATPVCLLGKSCTSVYEAGSATAAYNEVRIWKRALSEKELTQNAIKFYKAGETIKKD